MRQLHHINTALKLVGIDLRHMIRAARALPYFVESARRYYSLAKNGAFRFKLHALKPVLTDIYEDGGTGKGDYFHQDIWAARKIHSRKPVMHVDVGSRIDGFVAHLLVFMPVQVVDIKPFDSNVAGLSFVRGNATHLTMFEDDSVESLSSLHAVEHFGLGRYRDAVDPDAWLKAIREFVRVLRRGGVLYLSVPIGKERVEFNAHRIFSPKTVLQACSELSLVSFSAVDGDGNFVEQADWIQFEGTHYACGLFEFEKAGYGNR